VFAKEIFYTQNSAWKAISKKLWKAETIIKEKLKIWSKRRLLNSIFFEKTLYATEEIMEKEMQPSFWKISDNRMKIICKWRLLKYN